MSRTGNRVAATLAAIELAVSPFGFSWGHSHINRATDFAGIKRPHPELAEAGRKDAMLLGELAIGGWAALDAISVATLAGLALGQRRPGYAPVRGHVVS